MKAAFEGHRPKRFFGFTYFRGSTENRDRRVRYYMFRKLLYQPIPPVRHIIRFLFARVLRSSNKIAEGVRRDYKMLSCFKRSSIGLYEVVVAVSVCSGQVIAQEVFLSRSSNQEP